MPQLTPKPSYPYKGLMPYHEDDAQFFFGREALCEIIVSNLFASRLTLLYGSSGVGKSSVLRAGVVRHLQQLSQRNIDHRDPEFVVVFFNSWRYDPQEELMRRIGESVRSILETEKLESFKRCATLSGQIEFLATVSDCELFIILDQFEEYFLYHSTEGKEGSFAVEFARLVNRSDLRASFLVSIREDSLAKLDRFKGRITALFDNLLRVEHLDAKSARAAITNPIEQYNIVLHERIEIEAELIEAVLDQLSTGRVLVGNMGRGVVTDEGDERRIETPYLQLVMTRLWDEEARAGSRRLSLNTLERLGGAHRIVTSHLNDSMSGLSRKEQELASRIFKFLVTPSGTKIAYGASDLADYVNVDGQEVAAVMEKLADAGVRILRIVNPPRDRPNERYYEIFHDVLGPAILDWRARYVRETELERKTQRRDQLLVAALAIIALIVLATVYINSLRRDAQLAKAEAEAQKVQLQNALDTVHALDRALPFFKAVLRGHIGQVYDADFSPDGKLVVTADDEAARIWDVETGNSIAKLQANISPVHSVTFSQDGSLILTTMRDGSARVWNAATYQPLVEMRRDSWPLLFAGFSSDGKTILTGSQDNYVCLWDSMTGDLRLELPAARLGPSAAALSGDGRRVVTGGDNGTVSVLDTSTGQNIAKIAAFQSGIVFDVVLSPDGRLIAAIGGDGSASVCEAHTGRKIAVLRSQCRISGVGFSPQGKYLITVCTDGSLKVWEGHTGKSVATWQHVTSPIYSTIFSPNEERIATISDGNIVVVIDASTGRSQAYLRGHIDEVRSIAFNPNGESIVTSSLDGTARIWDLSKLDEIR